MRGYSHWSKSKWKHSKFVEISPNLLKLQTFLSEEAKVSGHPSFRLLCFKATFFVKVEDARSQGKSPATTALEHLVKHGFVECFRPEGTAGSSSLSKAASSPSAEAWLQAPLIHVFVESLGGGGGTAEDGPSTEHQVAQLLEDVQGTAALLKADVPHTDGIRNILSHLASVLKCTCSPVQAVAADVSAALAAFSNGVLKKWRGDLEATEAGAGLFGTAACLLQEAAKGAAGADKVQLARSKLLDERLPSTRALSHAKDDEQGEAVSEEDDDKVEVLCLDNVEVLVDGGACSVVAESLGLVQEALDLWTPMQLDHSADAVYAWFTAACVRVQSYDVFSSAWLSGFVGGPASAAQRDPDEESGVSGVRNKKEKTLLKDIAERLDASTLDENKLHMTAEQVLNLARRLPETFRRRDDCLALAKAMADRVLPNTKCRKQVVGVLEAACACTDEPATITAMIAEWRERVDLKDGSDDPSYLSCAMELLHACGQLWDMSLNHTDDDPDTECPTDKVLQFTFGGQEVKGSCRWALSFADWVLDLDIVAKVQGQVTECVQQAFISFTNTLHLSIAKPPAGSLTVTPTDTAQQLLPQLLQSGVTSRHAVGVAGNVHKTGPKASWPCDDFAELLTLLLGVVPDESCAVSFEPLCTPGADPVICTNKATLLGVCAFFRTFSKVIMTGAFFFEGAVSGAEGGEPCVVGHSLRVDLEVASQFLRQQTAPLLLQAKAGAFGTKEVLMGYPFVLSFDAAVVWLENFQATFPALGRFLVVALAEDIGVLSNEVSGATPRTEHIIGSTTYNPNLAKKHLLQWPSRNELSDLTLALHKSMASIAKVHAAWSLPQALHEDPATKDHIALGESVKEVATKAMTIIAALNVVHEMQGKQQVDRARDLITKRRDRLPGSLLAALEKVANGGSSSTASGSSNALREKAPGKTEVAPLTDK